MPNTQLDDPWRVRSRSRLDVLRTFLLDRTLARLAAQHRQQGFPLLAAAVGDHIGRVIATQGLYERDLLLALTESILPQLIPDALQRVMLDVGANIGNHTVYLGRCFRQVVAFEPNPSVAAILRGNVILNRMSQSVIVQEIGLSDAPASLPFLETIENLGGSRFLQEAESVGRATILNVVKGDDLLQGLALDGAVGLVKLDVEGFEMAAIKGLEATLRRDLPVLLFESHTEKHTRAMAAFLDTLGYDHLYSLEARRGRSSSLLFERLLRLLCGTDIYLQRLHRIEDRYYPMILATNIRVPAQ